MDVSVDQKARGRHTETLLRSTRPLYILTGFLGSGKTTILASLLARRGDVGVIVNEVGEIGIDQHLVEHVADDVKVLASGCICCSLRDDLAEAIERVDHAARAAGRRVSAFVLETTGIADPAPVVAALGRDPRLVAAVHLGSVTAVLDASRALALLDEHPEVARQLDLADRILLTKQDLAAPGAPSLVEAALDERFPGRPRSWVEHGRVGPDEFWATAPRIAPESGAGGWLAPLHDHGPGVDVRAIVLPSPVDLDAIALWHRVVIGLDGRSLLRIKGIVEADDGWWVIESAQWAVFPPRRLEAQPTGWTGSRLVVASRGLPEPALAHLEQAAVLAALGTPAQ